MPPKIALIVCITIIIVLLRIEQKSNPDVSWAVWLPTVWMGICASRPLGSWFNPGGADQANNLASGNPINQLALGILFLLSFMVLFNKRPEWREIIKDNRWLFLLYGYMLLSILWSDFPLVSFRRWTKILLGLVVALVLLSEKKPFPALESTIRRCIYVLIPLSLVLIKYFPSLGRQYNRWTGQLMWTGVAGQKNGLGALCALSIFFLSWSLIYRRKGGRVPLTQMVTADLALLLLSGYLLLGNSSSYSATSIFTLIIGMTFLIVMARIGAFRVWVVSKSRSMVVIMSLGYVLFNTLMLPVVTSALGRNTSLTGRKDIWNTALKIGAAHFWLGNGFGNLSVELELWEKHAVLQAHNGYLGVYMYLGIFGILLLIGFVLSFCGKVRGQKEENHEWATFAVCFAFMLLVYNYSESTFLTPNIIWSLAVNLYILNSRTSGALHIVQAKIGAF